MTYGCGLLDFQQLYPRLGWNGQGFRWGQTRNHDLRLACMKKKGRAWWTWERAWVLSLPHGIDMGGKALAVVV